ncbi:MAG: hypothetical protein PHF17_07250 [Arcobacteraceae bacterium]|nr:hypothetical protein [Arcobacteraceae bacterium]
MIYKNEEFELCDDFIDVGYMAENVVVEDLHGHKVTLQRSHSDKSMSLFVSFPYFGNGFVDEILKLDSLLKTIQVPLNCFFIFDVEMADKVVLKNRLEKFEIVFDSEDEFGNMYGMKIVDGTLKNKLTKGLFLINKDGSVFYIDIPDDLEKPLDIDRLIIELNKAYATYTGVGCHG